MLDVDDVRLVSQQEVSKEPSQHLFARPASEQRIELGVVGERVRIEEVLVRVLSGQRNGDQPW